MLFRSAMSTVDNALYTYEILEREGIETMTIVTSGYHQRRGQAIYNAVGAIYGQQHGYRVELDGNYCFDIEPSRDMYREDARIAAMQIGQLLNLPMTILGGLML